MRRIRLFLLLACVFALTAIPGRAEAYSTELRSIRPLGTPEILSGSWDDPLYGQPVTWTKRTGANAGPRYQTPDGTYLPDGEIWFRIVTNSSMQIELLVYDHAGRVVRSVLLQHAGTGEYVVPVAEADRVAGIYLGLVGNPGQAQATLEYLTFVQGLDLTPPAQPAGLVAEPGELSVLLRWEPNTEGDLAGYVVYLNGAEYDTTTATSYVIDGLPAGVPVTVGVAARDWTGNESPAATATVTPLAPLPPPGPPDNLRAEVGVTAVILRWNPPNGASASAYEVYRDGALLGDTSQTFWRDVSLQPSTEYEYAVVATNRAGRSPAAVITVRTRDPSKLGNVQIDLRDLGPTVRAILQIWRPILLLVIGLAVALYLLRAGAHWLGARWVGGRRGL